MKTLITALASPEHGQVIDLVYYHEKSVDEVAHILPTPRRPQPKRRRQPRRRPPRP
jgi:hypothetical protein